jgi:hypothetical protein
VHDRSIEDQLRTVLRREGDDLTLNITAQELERRLVLRRRARVGQRLRLVAAGLAVVAIGGIVVAGNGWFGGSGGQVVGGKPGPTTASLPSPSASAEPTPPELASPNASPGSSIGETLPCLPLDPTTGRPADGRSGSGLAQASLPDVVAAAVPGDSVGHVGTQVAALLGGAASGSPGTWAGLPDDPDSIAIAPPTTALEVISEGCFRSVTAEALLTVYAHAPTPSPTPIPLKFTSAPWPSRVVAISPPPTGGWTVRVRATFVTTDGSDAWSESLFRVSVPFDAPRLLMVHGSTTGEWANAQCPTYQLASGASASDQCGAPYEPINDPTEPLTIAKGSSVVVQLADAWRIDQAQVVAVDAGLVASGSFAPEYSVALVDKGGLQIVVPIDLDPRTWIVRVSLNGSKDGDSFGAYYDLPLTITP